MHPAHAVDGIEDFGGELGHETKGQTVVFNLLFDVPFYPAGFFWELLSMQDL